ncbi:MAG: 2-hydroxychromene-2-carboxylate isomerase [Betaproteobacteria bacterium]
MTASVDFHFDFVSPYSYIALQRLGELHAAIVYKPVLFAGLLNHWGQKGPAEIPAKRRWTYRWCTWWAVALGTPFRFPAAHPFNPLPYLRLAIVAGCTQDTVSRIFNFIWTTGADPTDASRFSALCADLGVDPARLPEARETLRKNTEDAAAGGVFGVPTFVVDGEVFWGADALDFLRAFLKDRAVLDNPEIRRVDALPVAASRSPSASSG